MLILVQEHKKNHYLEEQIIIKDKQIIDANERLEKLEATINELKQLIKNSSSSISNGQEEKNQEETWAEEREEKEHK